jgi:hypothetical protein
VAVTAQRRLLLGLYVALIPLVTRPALGCDIDQWRPEIAAAAERLHVDDALIRAVIRVESDACEHTDGKPTTSAAGAMGLMQLMPPTWSRYRDRLGLGHDPYQPRENILAGTAYLHDLIRELGLLNAVAAYFAGQNAILGERNDNSRLSGATLRYVRDVLELLVSGDAQRGSEREDKARLAPRVFAIRRPSDEHGERLERRSASALFAIRRAGAKARDHYPDHAEPPR